MLSNLLRSVSRSYSTAFIVLAVALGVTMPAPGGAPSPTNGTAEPAAMPKRGISAHRGASTTHPENTLVAFREAIRLGAHQIELDVYLTRDGSLVVMHDATVDRTTDGTGPVTGFTLDEIKRLDAGSWKGQQFAGERVPTLAEALKIMPRNTWLNLHLRGGSDIGTAVAKEVLRHGRKHQAFLAAGHQAADAARRVDPDILICNMERQGHDAIYVTDTIRRGDQFIQFLGKLPAEEDMKRIHEAGVRVNYCCTNDPTALPRLFKAGVQFPLVDDVGTMMEAARQLGIEPNRPAFE